MPPGSFPTFPRPSSPGPAAANRTDGLIDPDTPAEACVIQVPGLPANLTLVLSDEFNADGRQFGAAANDSKWTAIDAWYQATQDLEVYKTDAVTTQSERLLAPSHKHAHAWMLLLSDGECCSAEPQGVDRRYLVLSLATPPPRPDPPPMLLQTAAW